MGNFVLYLAFGNKLGGPVGEKSHLLLCMLHSEGHSINILWDVLENFLAAQLNVVILMLKTNRLDFSVIDSLILNSSHLHLPI